MTKRVFLKLLILLRWRKTRQRLPTRGPLHLHSHQGLGLRTRLPQRRHRAPAVPLGDAADHLDLGLGAAEDLQGRQAFHDVEEVTAQQARAQLDVNVVAPAVVASCALPAMRERGTGRIVMVSSIAGRAAIMPLNGWYHASKFALADLPPLDRLPEMLEGFAVDVREASPLQRMRASNPSLFTSVLASMPVYLG